MKPLIFEFIEYPEAEKLDYTLIEYNHDLHLSVHTETGKPAIDVVNMDTELFTKTQGEQTESDRTKYSSLLDTETQTRTYNEVSDDDKDRFKLQMLLDTTTMTLSTEGTDQDNQRNDINNYSQN